MLAILTWKIQTYTDLMCVCHVLRVTNADRHVTAGSSGVGDVSGAAFGISGAPHGCAAVPNHGVDVQR